MENITENNLLEDDEESVFESETTVDAVESEPSHKHESMEETAVDDIKEEKHSKVQFEVTKPIMNQPITEHVVMNTRNVTRRQSSSAAQRPMFHEKPQDHFITGQTILLQPEMLFLQSSMKKASQKDTLARSLSKSGATTLSEEELELVRRFPWLAQKLKLAWEEVKQAETLQYKLKATKTETKKSTSILKQRDKAEKAPLKLDDDEDKKSKPKVVFSRNIPLFVYSSDAKKAIRVGGDINDHMTEEVYKAMEYNPELKKITLDLQNLCKPESDKTIHLAVSYLSATTDHNPLVISEHMARFSAKKESTIKYIVKEIEARLLSQREVRQERDAKWQKQLEDIVRARLEAEERENDFLLAKRQLEESRRANTAIMTVVEREQERRRRITLRSRVIPVADRLKTTQRTKRVQKY